MMFLRYWQLLVGGLGCLILGIMLLSAKGDARHWRKQSDHYAGLYRDEKVAHALTVSGYRAKADEARRLDAANKARVEAEQRAVNERNADEYEARIAALRERYARLVRERGAPAADPGGSGGSAMPGAGATARGSDGAAAEGGLSTEDALIATEQAIQLEALQKWAREQAGVAN